MTTADENREAAPVRVKVAVPAGRSQLPPKHGDDRHGKWSPQGEAVIQVYVPIHDRRIITIPAVVRKALGVEEGQWLRMTALDDERTLVERVMPEAPDHMARGAISSQRAT